MKFWLYCITLFAFTLTSCGNQDHTKEYDEYFTNKGFIGQAYISKKRCTWPEQKAVNLCSKQICSNKN